MVRAVRFFKFYYISNLIAVTDTLLKKIVVDFILPSKFYIYCAIANIENELYCSYEGTLEQIVK